MGKRITLVLFLILFVLLILYGGTFLARNFKGVLPLLRDVEEDIAQTLQKEISPFTFPEAFSLSVFADGLGKPRVLTLDPLGNLVVSIPSRGQVVALPDRDRDSMADEEIVILENLNSPHGLAFRCFLDELGVEERCQLFVAEEDRVMRYNYDKQTFAASDAWRLLDLPAGGNHVTRTLLLHPDGKRLLVSIGSSCNVCNEGDERRATILATDFEGGSYEVFARGLRNAVFMKSHPGTAELWVTEMGRDFLGDDLPPDEINLVREGRHYGWPTCYGKNIHDTDFDKNTYVRAPCSEPFEEPSFIDIPAHSSPLGLSFVPQRGWPEEFADDLFVAYHGSWNRSVPTGYKVVRMVLDENGRYERTEDFITGWFTGESGVLGRPVDILTLPEGIMYISDDRAGVIYRVSYDS